MSSFTLTNNALFPNGTVVKAYLTTNWPTPTLPSGAPIGSSAAEATMTAGTLTFSGLTEGTRYWAVAEVGGVYHYEKFVAGADLAGSELSPAAKAEVEKLAGEGGGAAVGSIGEAGKAVGTDNPAITILDLVPENFGAVGNGTTDDTAAFQATSKAIVAAGGGTVRLAGKTYIVDGYEWETSVHFEGAAAGHTKLKAKAGSSNPGQILQAKGLVKYCGWRNITFEPNGNLGQCSFYLFAETGGSTEGGVNAAYFEDCTWLGSWSGHAMWWDGGKSGGKFPHQFINFKRCFISHKNSGSVTEASSGELIGPTTARGIKCTGQCAKFTFDNATSIQGQESEAGPVGGLNVELTRRFTFATTLTSDAAAAATKVKVKSATGFATNQVFTIGEGYHNEVCEVESVSGSEITLKAPLVFAHAAADTNLRLLTTGATNTPAFFTFEDGCTLQNADLQILAESVRWLNLQRGADFENQARGVLARRECRQVNMDVSVSGASEGTSNGSGTLTVGSATVTASGGTWAEGDTIVGKGIKAGTTLTTVVGSTLTLSNPVEANGTEGPVAGVPLTKGGNGEGFIAKFEGESEGSVSYDTNSAIDRGVVQV